MTFLVLYVFFFSIISHSYVTKCLNKSIIELEALIRLKNTYFIKG